MPFENPPPEPPLSTSPATFDSRADAWFAWVYETGLEWVDAWPTVEGVEGFAAEAQAAASAAIASTTYTGTSTTSIALTTGSKSITTQTGKAFVTGDEVVLISRTDRSVRGYGSVSAYTSGSGAMTVNVTEWEGAGGPFTSWVVILAPFEPVAGRSQLEAVIVDVGDEEFPLASGAGKRSFRLPYDFKLEGVRASLKTAQASGSIFTVDINRNGSSILSTKLTIDNTEKTSKTAATPAVISAAALTDDDEITIDIDQIGNGTAVGLKVTLIGRQP